MPEFTATVEIKGLDKLIRDARDGFGIAAGAENGIRRGSVIVETAARRIVHKRSRKLHDSTGHYIEGTGMSTRGHVGPRPGFGAPRGYNSVVGSGQSFEVAGRRYYDSTRKKRRRVRAVNRSDPQEYGRYEELGTRYRPGHPWLVPALDENKERIQRTFTSAIRDELKRRAGR